ncbi:MAG TPA: GIDE domain-containing protein, partial [Kofleriaceae bacterium]|nr:GIDE domain-containing protein [Kofleriaceae bacterium]
MTLDLAAYYHGDSSGTIFAIAIVVIAIILIVGFVFSKSARLKRKLRAAKAWAIGDLPEDTLGRVVGQARPLSSTLQGPLTGRPCLYYIAKVEEQRSNGRSSYWKTVITESQGVPFVIEDSTGRAIVDPGNAEVALDFDGKSSSGRFHDANEIQEAFLAKYGKKSSGWVLNKSLRYREAMIEVGETVAVLGSGVRE